MSNWSSFSSLSSPSSRHQPPVPPRDQQSSETKQVTICKIAHPEGCKTPDLCAFRDSQVKQIEKMQEEARRVGRICGRLYGHLPPDEGKNLLHTVSEMGSKFKELFKECLQSMQISEVTGQYPKTALLLNQKELCKEIQGKAEEAESLAVLLIDTLAQPQNRDEDEKARQKKAFQEAEEALKDFPLPEDSSLSSTKEETLEQLKRLEEFLVPEALFSDLLTCLQNIQGAAKVFAEDLSKIIREQTLAYSPQSSITLDSGTESAAVSAKKQLIIAVCSSLSLGTTLAGVALLLLLNPIAITPVLILSLTLIVLGSSILAMLVAASLIARAKRSPEIELAKQSSFSHFYQDAPSGHGIK